MDMEELLSQLPPEALQQLLGLGTLDERDALLQQQMQQAEALRRGSGKEYSTGAGAALGGLGDMVRAVRGRMMDKDATTKREELLGKKDAGRNAYVEALRRRPQQPAVMPPSQGQGQGPSLGVGQLQIDPSLLFGMR
jgi:uncharacterized small protein (DUF1192 family)